MAVRSNIQTREDFSKARSKARMQSLLTALQWKNTSLLSFYEVTKLVKPKSETYRGVIPIEVSKIIGSEGRYHDFTLAFYPKKDMLRSRWQSIDDAHLKHVTLPPISVYKLSDYYFVRDGNHRVSVAKMQGVEFIDAEVVELDSEIYLEAGMTTATLRKMVVEYEKKRVIAEYHIDEFLDLNTVKFSSPGMYPELINHIMVHKYYMNEENDTLVSFREAAENWYRNIYHPIYAQIREDALLKHFPGKTYGDLYLWIVRRWDDLKAAEGADISIRKAAQDMKLSVGRTRLKRLCKRIGRFFTERSR